MLYLLPIRTATVTAPTRTARVTIQQPRLHKLLLLYSSFFSLLKKYSYV